MNLSLVWLLKLGEDMPNSRNQGLEEQSLELLGIIAEVNGAIDMDKLADGHQLP